MNRIIEKNQAKAKEFAGEKGDTCYKTAKGWARVSKCRVVGDDCVVYLDTIGAERKRVKLAEKEVAKLESAPLAKVSAEATAKKPGRKPAKPKNEE